MLDTLMLPKNIPTHVTIYEMHNFLCETKQQQTLFICEILEESKKITKLSIRKVELKF